MPEFAKVRRWPSCEINGQILVWFHCDGEDPQWAVPEQEEITKGEWVYRGRTEHFINAHIQVRRGIWMLTCRMQLYINSLSHSSGGQTFNAVIRTWWPLLSIGNTWKCSGHRAPRSPAYTGHGQRGRSALYQQQNLGILATWLESEDLFLWKQTCFRDTK